MDNSVSGGIYRYLSALVLLTAALVAISPCALAQSIIGTVFTGEATLAIGVNPATNKIYATNY